MTPDRLTGFVQGVLMVSVIWLFKEVIADEIKAYCRGTGIFQKENRFTRAP